jgi:hypothetical protein
MKSTELEGPAVIAVPQILQNVQNLCDTTADKHMLYCVRTL